MPADGGAAPFPGDDEDEDTCLSGTEHVEGEATSDEELPPASGGVQTAEAKQQGNEDSVDGCDLDFTNAPQTDDADLPAATGGM
ncbi:MAG TPA: hypothetical protein VEK73_15140 [Xanthobacteraceae bacterium]|nr:hypothetical protein [Xanthobacteraceae bacterium]